MTTFRELSNLAGRRALITGAAGGLGRVFADTLAELGAELILVDRQDAELDIICSELELRWGVNVEYHKCDLEIESQRLELITRVMSSKKQLNILVNNAAFVGTSKLQGWNVPFEEQSLDAWRSALEVNLTAVFDLSRGLVPLLKISKGGNIINIASIYGMFGPDWRLYDQTTMSNPAAYGVSKGGLIQLTRWLATTISPEVRVNAISPGGILRGQPTEFVSRYVERTPLKRMASEEDFRGAIAFLASDLSNYVTGQILSVEGGWGVW
jgi:NAD(P)-dependent dehydrogenase (short-subunit alcohol dehydrogenase family)